jgi:hypothetical protein
MGILFEHPWWTTVWLAIGAAVVIEVARAFGGRR